MTYQTIQNVNSKNSFASIVEQKTQIFLSITNDDKCKTSSKAYTTNIHILHKSNETTKNGLNDSCDYTQLLSNSKHIKTHKI